VKTHFALSSAALRRIRKLSTSVSSIFCLDSHQYLYSSSGYHSRKVKHKIGESQDRFSKRGPGKNLLIVCRYWLVAAGAWRPKWRPFPRRGCRPLAPLGSGGWPPPPPSPGPGHPAPGPGQAAGLAATPCNTNTSNCQSKRDEISGNGPDLGFMVPTFPRVPYIGECSTYPGTYTLQWYLIKYRTPLGSYCTAHR